MQKIVDFHRKILDGKGFYYLCLRKILFFFSLFFRLIVFVKGSLHKCGLFSVQKVDAFVVSIGNISCGGTGKTPLTLLLSKEIQNRKKVAILSRGYQAKNKKISIACDGSGPFYEAKKIGDEPFLLARRLIKPLLIIGKNRLKSAKMAVNRKCEVILLDDGMQYKKLHKDFQIVTMKSFDLFGNGFFLPRGFLRDHPKRLSDSDLVFVSPVHSKMEYENIQKKLRPFTKAPIIGAKPYLVSWKTLEGKTASLIPGSKVAIFCGIGQPKGFEDSVKQLGYSVILKLFLNDHEKISSKRASSFSKKATDLGAKYLLCTEKDAVKTMQKDLFSLPVLYMEMDVKITYGELHWKMLIEKIVSNRNNQPA